MKKSKEHYPGEKRKPYDYNYDQENPNALISGKNISGSVYSSYPSINPGLGWII
jgi:hypothetical protein